MGFWSTLAKVGTSFIPGVGPLVSSLIGAGGQVAGAALDARNANRSNQAHYGLQRDQAEFDRQRAVNEQIRTMLAGRQASTGDAVRGGMMQGLRDASVTRPAGIPNTAISGGLRPSAVMGADRIGQILQARALREMQGGHDLPQLSPIAPLSQPQQPGAVDKWLGIVNLIGGGLSLWQDAKNNQPKTTPPYLPPTTVQPGVDRRLMNTTGVTFR